MGALLPIAVWARDERFGPGFLWTLPVDRRRHALTKVLAGWVWLMGGVALFVLWLLAVTVGHRRPGAAAGDAARPHLPARRERARSTRRRCGQSAGRPAR